MILFGVSKMLSDIYDCVTALNRKVTQSVLNEPEQMRERTKGFEARLGELNERPVVINLDDFEFKSDEEYFVVPTNPKKSELIAFLQTNYGMRFANLIHPTAYLSPHAKIGQGVYIGARSVIAPGAVLKDHVFVNRGVTVGHDTVIHEYVRLQPGSNIGGHVAIFPNVMIGMGANVIEELVIGKGAIVAAGAAVISDVQDRTLVAGVPAVVKKVYAG